MDSSVQAYYQAMVLRQREYDAQEQRKVQDQRETQRQDTMQKHRSGKSVLTTLMIGLGVSTAISSVFILLSTLVMTSNCAGTSNFDPYVGPVKWPPEPLIDQGTFQGRGGERTVVKGVAFWSSGAPPCKYEALGSLTWTGEPGRDWRESVADRVLDIGGTSLLLHDVSLGSQEPQQPSIARTIAYARTVATMGAQKAPRPSLSRVSGMVVRCLDPNLRTKPGAMK